MQRSDQAEKKDCNGEEETTTQIRVVDLEPGAIVHIFSFLSIRDICAATATCKAFRDASRHDTLWRTKALERYPPTTVQLCTQHYASHRDLLRDDNLHHTSLYIPLHATSCDYKYNRTDYFFECCVTGIEWDRANDCLRLFFDARGEPDLRHPLTSSLGVVIHRKHPNRRSIRKEIVEVAKSREALRETVNQLLHDNNNDGNGNNNSNDNNTSTNNINHSERHFRRYHSAVHALNIANARMNHLMMELRDASTPTFSDMVTVLRPSICQCATPTPTSRHYQGWLEFPSISQIDALASELPSSWRLKHELARCGVDVIFSYANSVPVMPQDHLADYFPAHVLHIPPGDTVGSVFRGSGVYVGREEERERMRHEGEEVGVARWRHVAEEMSVSGRDFYSTWFHSTGASAATPGT